MQELINKHLANGLAEFQGLHIVGKVPITQQLINEFIAEFLRKQARPAHATHAASTNGSGGGIEASALLHLVKKAYVEAQDGKIIVQFELHV